MDKKTLLFVGGGVLVIYLIYQRRKQEQAYYATQPLVNRPGTLGTNGPDSTMNSIANLFGSALNVIKGLTKNNTTDGKSSGGVGTGSGTGGSAAGGPGQNQGRLTNTQPNPVNLGSYVGLDGQLYNKDGQALDDNGNVIAGVYDNSGTGPSGAGINADNTIAANPLTFTDNTSPMFGVVAPLNTGALSIPVQPDGGNGSMIQSIIASSQSSGVPSGSQLAGGSNLPASAIGESWIPPIPGYAGLIPDPQITGADESGTANRTLSGNESDASLVQGPDASGNGSFGSFLGADASTVSLADAYAFSGGGDFSADNMSFDADV